MWYTRDSQDFRSGGFSNRGTGPSYLSFSPETADTYEIGSKNEFFDSRPPVNLTGFHTKIKNFQFGSILTIPHIPGTDTVVNNSGGDADTWGIELQSTWFINDLFSLTATYR